MLKVVLCSVARAKRTLECRKNGRRVVGRAKEGSWKSEESCGVDDGTWDWRFYTRDLLFTFPLNGQRLQGG